MLLMSLKKLSMILKKLSMILKKFINFLARDAHLLLKLSRELRREMGNGRFPHQHRTYTSACQVYHAAG